MSNFISNADAKYITLFFDLDHHSYNPIKIVNCINSDSNIYISNETYENYYYLNLTLPEEITYRVYIIEFFIDFRIMFYFDTPMQLNNYQISKILEKNFKYKFNTQSNLDSITENLDNINLSIGNTGMINSDTLYSFALIVDKNGSYNNPIML